MRVEPDDVGGGPLAFETVEDELWEELSELPGSEDSVLTETMR